MSNEKLNNIESTVAHQEQQILDLSEMVAKQWDEINILKTRLARVQDKLNVVEDTANSAGSGDGMSVSEMAASQKPPHY